jgi:UDP-N-acetylglucosamine 4,6-dehydratase
MKQVPACEDNPWEALQTNTMGAMAVASACLDAGVRRAVYLSTDKAAAPNTLYGATKLAGERIWIGANVYAAGRDTRFVATRYGNVIGSRGSVVPIFSNASLLGSPISVTDPAMSRFWMTLDQAVGLVETALTEGRGGEVFVPKAPSCDMATVAEAFAPNCQQKITGARRGEKKHETLISEDEARDTRDVGDHYRIEPVRVWEAEEDTLPGLPVPEGWSYRSDTNDWKITAEELRTLWP